MRRARHRRVSLQGRNEQLDGEEEEAAGDELEAEGAQVRRRRVAQPQTIRNQAFQQENNVYEVDVRLPSDESDIESESDAEAEEPLDDSIIVALADLNLKRSALIDLHSLELLCVRSVAANLPYFLSKKQPFNGLPPALLERLMKELDSMHLISSIEIFTRLITPHSRYAMLDFAKKYQWVATDRLRAMTHISNTCSGSLQHLILKINDLNTALCPPRARNVFKLLSTLHNLQHLELARAGLQNEGLLTVATHCRQLRILNVSFNHPITNDGVRMLCGERPVTDYGCQKLEELDLRSTGVTHDGLYYVLDCLPNIKKLLFPEIDRAILDLNNPVKLENVLFSTIRYQDEVDIICSKIPCVNDIGINCYIANLKPLENLKNVRKLAVCSSSVDINEVLSLVQVNSTTLTSLELGAEVTIDLSIIGYHCLYLQSLKWGSYVARESKYELNKEHFSRLTTLEVRYCHEYRNFPAWGLLRLMSSENLSSVCIENMTIPDNVLESLVIEARSGRALFSELKSLSMTFCDRINFLTVQHIICLAPKLKKIDCCASLGPTTVWKRVIKFIKQHTPYISVNYIYTRSLHHQYAIPDVPDW